MMATSHGTDVLEPGRLISGRYRVGQEIGRGNMATVYLAIDEGTDQEVAIKVMSARLTGRADRVQRFLNEYRFGVKVGRHENIVAVLANGRIGGEDGTPYLVMERIAGPSLDLMLAMQRKLDAVHASHIALGVAEGLDAVHRAGVVHRDVKPSNVMVARLASGRGEVAKILDFGLATAIGTRTGREGELRQRLTLHEQIPGSAGYMAPEVAERAEPHPSADVFGFGMLLAELACGRNPYEGATREKYITEVTREGWALPAALLDEIESSKLRALVVACTQRRPEDRPTMSEVVRFLDETIAPAGTPVDSMAATNPRLEGGADTSDELAMPSRPPLVRPWAWVWVALVMMVVCGGLGAAILLLGDPPTGADGSDYEPVADVPLWSASLAAMTTSGDETSSGGETGAAFDGSAPATDSASSIDPTGGARASEDADPALVVRPRGKKPPRMKAKESHPGSTGSRPEYGPPEPLRGASTPECELIHDSISAMRAEGGWSRILFLVGENRACFGRAEYRRIRVEALARSGRHTECVEIGSGSDDPEVRALVDECRRKEP